MNGDIMLNAILKPQQICCEIIDSIKCNVLMRMRSKFTFLPHRVLSASLQLMAPDKTPSYRGTKCFLSIVFQRVCQEMNQNSSIMNYLQVVFNVSKIKLTYMAIFL